MATSVLRGTMPFAMIEARLLRRVKWTMLRILRVATKFCMMVSLDLIVLPAPPRLV
ncbi:hypothetical protein M218_14050 [Burkholderia pseudomallei MSHR338]|nr:hypothetical protein M218_14050 [Burkholderia pseudomallei MSHR338]